MVAAAARNASAEPEAPPPSNEELAQKLSNPLAALISIPIQMNLDIDGGPAGGGSRYLVNFQPVIPFTLSSDWNVISRTIVPVLYQNEMISTSTHEYGLADISESLWLSPRAVGPGPLIWGVGPVVAIPTATDDPLGTGKLSIGPTAVGLVQASGWTGGVLANHVWSVAGSSSRSAVSMTFMQPFISYTTKTYTTFSATSETTYDWENSRWTVPVNAMVSQLLKLGPLPVQFGAGPRVYLEGPMGAPDWGIRFAATMLLPK